MTGADPLPPAVLRRKAVVYVRQSTPAQVETTLESGRRQYELVDVARSRGFRDVEVIDDDLGRSASGMVARPGFERLVAGLGGGGGVRAAGGVGGRCCPGPRPAPPEGGATGRSCGSSAASSRRG